MTTAIHYETKVPAPFNPIRDLVKGWADEVTEEAARSDDCEMSRVNEVENESRDGFIPFTDGGFDGIIYATLRNAHGTGSVPDVIQPYLDRAIKDVEKDWDEANPDHPISWLYADADGQLELLGPSKERDHWREKFHEFEDEHLSEGGTYFYKIRALFLNGESWTKAETGEPEVLFCVGINTDFEYGRDTIPWLAVSGGNPNCTTWVWQKTVKAADITAELIETFKAEALEALAKA